MKVNERKLEIASLLSKSDSLTVKEYNDIIIEQEKLCKKDLILSGEMMMLADIEEYWNSFINNVKEIRRDITESLSGLSDEQHQDACRNRGKLEILEELFD